jgi:hypothetical protein
MRLINQKNAAPEMPFLLSDQNVCVLKNKNVPDAGNKKGWQLIAASPS